MHIVEYNVCQYLPHVGCWLGVGWLGAYLCTMLLLLLHVLYPLPCVSLDSKLECNFSQCQPPLFLSFFPPPAAPAPAARKKAIFLVRMHKA